MLFQYLSLSHVFQFFLTSYTGGADGRGDMAKIGWHIDYGSRHFIGGKVNPLPIIAFGSIPMSLMRTIPVTLVEEDIHIHVRGKNRHRSGG